MGLLPKSRALGITDNILPLGDLFDLEQVAQGLYVVSDTHCPALLDWELQ